MTEKDVPKQERISPSEFMRQLRPEYFSDTEKDQVAYALDQNGFEYHLETITNRNETQKFETFCRKLSERTICPNLRAHTGPDGGGDSKVDTETYPVSDKIFENFYVGETKSGEERWAFAFSANEDWKRKVKDDVKKIAETDRDYKRIIFITSRFAKDKDRADLEDFLSKEYGIPVIIHDRSWIVQEVIDKDRKDLAFNYLGVGKENSDPLRLGPKDYSRSKQLKDIEADLDKPEVYDGMERQRVTDALLAAKLSRNLEKPRSETDGRFAKAIRYAEADGSERQKLEAKYEHIWTSLCWFDDFEFLKNSYEDFEQMALQSDQAVDLEFLCTLLQLLYNGVIHDYLDPVECKLEGRTDTLRTKLETIANDQDRPNNAAEAQLSLIFIRVNQAIMNGQAEKLSDIWRDFSELLKKVEGLGEFRANRLEQMIDVAGQIAGNDPAYNALVEQAAEFFAKREGDVKSAGILLNRAEQLDFDQNFEMIRLLGKASIRLTKREHAELLIQAMHLLTLAYRSAGMLWAARASCIMLASALIIEAEEESQIPARFVPAMKLWGWIALELGNIPDFLFAIQMLNGAVACLPLTDESKARVQEDLQELDMALGCLFLNLDEQELQKLASVPDVIDALGLYMARAALLYTLGYEDALHDDGSIPERETEEGVIKIFSSLYSQPAAESLPRYVHLNEDTPQSLKTFLIGMQVEINFDPNQKSAVIQAQSIIAALEAFFSTTLEQRISPHREKLILVLHETNNGEKPSFEIDTTKMEGIVKWPKDLSLGKFEHQGKVHEFMTEIAGKVLAALFVISDPKALLEDLYTNEEVHQRMATAIFSANSFSRVTMKEVLKLSDWQDRIKETYDLKPERPVLQKIEFPTEQRETTLDTEGPIDFVPPKITDHRAVKIHSLIDVHAWDQAKWRGTAYAQFSPHQPPGMAFLFENEEGARKIFEGWKGRLGAQDTDDEIYVSIIRHLPDEDEHHYCLQISSKLPDPKDMSPNKIITMASRSIVMTPTSNTNLETFLESYQHSGSYYLMPAILNPNGHPKLLYDVSILKRELVVKSASDIKQQDIEAMAMSVLSQDK